MRSADFSDHEVCSAKVLRSSVPRAGAQCSSAALGERTASETGTTSVSTIPPRWIEAGALLTNNARGVTAKVDIRLRLVRQHDCVGQAGRLARRRIAEPTLHVGALADHPRRAERD